MLEAVELSLAVPGRVLCRELSVRFGAGESWAILGRNGSGKSTLVHALAGLAAPAAGRVELNGAPIGSLRDRERARRMSVLTQVEPGTYWGSALDYVRLGRYPHVESLFGPGRADDAIAHAALAAVGLAGFERRAYATLSGGERQRVRIAQMVAQDTGVMLLDEPLQHLDLAHQAQILKLVAERVAARRQTAVMVLHEPLWLGRCCTHALVLFGDGTAEAGPARSVLNRDCLERAYGCALTEIGEAGERAFVPHV